MTLSKTALSFWMNCRGFIIVGACLIVAMLAIDLTMESVYGHPPTALIGRYMPFSTFYEYEAAARVSGAMEAARHGDTEVDGFGVIIGASSARRGIDPAIVEDADGSPMRWMMVTGVGGNFQNMQRISRALVAAPLQPSVVVLAVHPMFMVGTPMESLTDDPKRTTAWQAFRRGSIRRGFIRILQRRWFMKHAFHLRAVWLQTEFDARLTLAQHTDSLEAAFVPDADPWRIPKVRPMNSGDAIKAFQLKRWGQFGWFDESSYREDLELARIFGEMIDTFQTRGATVYVVTAPYHSELRTRMPQRAYDVLGGISHAAGATAIDLEASMPDDAYYDYVHLNREGRAAFSKILGESLGQQMRTDGIAGH